MIGPRLSVRHLAIVQVAMVVVVLLSAVPGIDHGLLLIALVPLTAAQVASW